MSVLKQLDLAERIENLAGQIYRRLAEQFDADPPTRALFRTLADEEDQHALRVRMLRNRFVKNDKAVNSVQVDLATAEVAAKHAEAAYGKLLTEPPATPQAARHLARDLEVEFAAVHAEFLTRDCDPEVRKLFTMLAEQDKQHAALAK